MQRGCRGGCTGRGAQKRAVGGTVGAAAGRRYRACRGDCRGQGGGAEEGCTGDCGRGCRAEVQGLQGGL